MRKVTDKRKLKEKRGTGTGPNYKPWIIARELGSIGTESVFNDWKHGRPIQCLSQGEKYAYHILRWQDDVLDIREQFPLDLDITTTIARKLGLPHPHNLQSHMTTDFLVDYRNPDGSRYQKAYSVKPNRSKFNKYALKNFTIEQTYWGLNGIHLEIIFSDNINKIYVNNIMQCVPYYKISAVHSRTDLVKHLIAIKVFPIDMESEYLNFAKLASQYASKLKKVQEYLSKQQQKEEFI